MCITRTVIYCYYCYEQFKVIIIKGKLPKKLERFCDEIIIRPIEKNTCKPLLSIEPKITKHLAHFSKDVRLHKKRD